MKLSENFSLQELTTTSHKDLIEVNIKEAQLYINNLKELANSVLQPLRDLIQKPITITSGFRGSKLNERVKGSKTSQHSYGEAADLVVKGLSTDELFKIIKENLNKFNGKLGQVIIEKVGNSEWIHISLKTERYAKILLERYGSSNTVFLKTSDGKTFSRV